jgi:hypothetical protein
MMSAVLLRAAAEAIVDSDRARASRDGGDGWRASRDGGDGWRGLHAEAGCELEQ